MSPKPPTTSELLKHVLLDPEITPVVAWHLTGTLVHVELVKGDVGHVPTRPLAGWATTYGKLGPDGQVLETVDRDGQVMDAAAEAGRIDWSGYVQGGLWNDMHRAPLPDGRMPAMARGRRATYVGTPRALEFCGATHPLAKAHRKVGYFTAGHLWDRRDPESWRRYGNHLPTPEELDRADHYWELADLVKGTDRPIGFSLHGLMATSPCKKRIIYARVNGLALCELPRNPDTTAEAELIKAFDIPEGSMPLAQAIGRSRVGAAEPPPCGRCACPPGMCGQLLRKATGTAWDTGPIVSHNVPPHDPAPSPRTTRGQYEAHRADIVSRMMARYNLREEEANTFFDVWLSTLTDPDGSQDVNADAR